MVDWYGNWHPEDDYSKYPEEKWCDCDRIADWIRKERYKPRTSIKNLVHMILLHFENPDNTEEYGDDFTLEECKRYVEESGGLREFDWCVD